MEAVVARQVDQGEVVDDAAIITFAGDRGLHAVVEQLVRRPAQRLERRNMATQHRRQVLMHHEPGPDQSAVAQHHGEQPHDPRRARLVGEHHLELGEVHLALIAGPGLVTHLVGGSGRRPHVAEEVGHSGVAALVTPLLQLPQQPGAAQPRIGRDPLMQISRVRVQQHRPRLARPVRRRLQTALDVAPHRLAIEVSTDARSRSPKAPVDAGPGSSPALPA